MIFTKSSKNRSAVGPSQVDTVNRRTVLLGGASTGLFGGLIWQLYNLQIVQQEQFATLSDDNRFYFQLSPPRRGRILDRKGVEIAGSIENFQVYATPYQLEDLEYTARKVLAAVHPFGEVDPRRLASIVASLRNRDTWYGPVLLAENLNWEAFARVNMLKPELPGVQMEVGETRAYGLKTATGQRAHAEAFAHVVGYVKKPWEEYVQDQVGALADPAQRRRLLDRLYHPATRVGQQGLERTMDEALSGQWGYFRVEMDARSRVVREIGYDPEPQPGPDLGLTLDADVQAYAQQRLYGESGAAAAIDVNTGEVVCLVSAPAYDPNLFAAGIGARAYRALDRDQRAPLINKTIYGLYAPGSTFKMITAIAALRAGVITPDTRIFCSGKIRLGDREFHCWKDEGHGSVDLRKSLKESCDCYYYEVARALYRRRDAPDHIAAVAAEFGLGEEAFDLAVPGGRGGVVPGRDYDLRVMTDNRQVPQFNAEVEAFNFELGLAYEERSQFAVRQNRLSDWYFERMEQYQRAIVQTPLPETSWLEDEDLRPDRYNDLVREYNRAISRQNALAEQVKSSIVSYVNQPRMKRGLQLRLPRLSLGDRLNEAIGQGYVLASPLQLAVMTARIANGGRKIEPVVLKDQVPRAEELAEVARIADPLHIKLMQDAMFSVTEEAGGTAFISLRRDEAGRYDPRRGSMGVDEDVLLAGKTGTSQVRRISAEERARGVIDNADLPWRRRDHGLFVGYAPYDKPKYAIAVIVEHGGGGSSAAARPARDILKHILKCDRARSGGGEAVCDVTTLAGLDGQGRRG